MGQARNRMLQLSDSFPKVRLFLNKARVGQISDKDALERSCVILMEELLKLPTDTNEDNITIKCPECDILLYTTMLTKYQLANSERNANNFTPIGNQLSGENGKEIPTCNNCGSRWIIRKGANIHVSTSVGVLTYGPQS